MYTRVLHCFLYTFSFCVFASEAFRITHVSPRLLPRFSVRREPTTVLCEEVAAESMKPGSSCWGYCNSTFASESCDQAVADWSAHAEPSEKFSTAPGAEGCSSDTFRFLCVMQATPKTLCSSLASGTLQASASCWTDCGAVACPNTLLASGDYQFAAINPSRDIKMADCDAATQRRRLCRISTPDCKGPHCTAAG